MKNVKLYFLSFLAALSIVLLAFGADKTFATTEATYDIVLTKVKMANLTDWPKQTGADGTEYTGQQLNIQNYFGAGSETLPGVWFEVHKYDDSKADKVGELVAGQEGQTS